MIFTQLLPRVFSFFLLEINFNERSKRPTTLIRTGKYFKIKTQVFAFFFFASFKQRSKVTYSSNYSPTFIISYHRECGYPKTWCWKQLQLVHLYPGLTKRYMQWLISITIKKSCIVFILFYFPQNISQASYFSRVMQSAKELTKLNVRQSC